MTRSPTEYRRLRGLLLHSKRRWPRIRRARRFHRGLFVPFPVGEGIPGICRWCELPTRGKLRWHNGCLDAYRAAIGQSVTYLWTHQGRPPCPCGTAGTELDHQDALVLAWNTRDPHRMLRAASLKNLTWLCQKCHREKTTRDMSLLNELRQQQTCLMGLIPTHDHRLGARYWASVESGLITRIEFGDGHMNGTKPTQRRGPVTFCPERTTCPTCLIAMEYPHQEDATRDGQLLTMPRRWHIDERNARWERSRSASISMSPSRQRRYQDPQAAAMAAGQMPMLDIDEYISQTPSIPDPGEPT